MSDIPAEEVADVLGELAKVKNAEQFLNGVQNSPELVFQAVKTLAEQSIGDGTAASQLQNTYKQLIEKEKELLATSNELELVRNSVNNLKKSCESNNVLGKLAEVLDKLQFQSSRSANVREGSVFNGDKKFFPIWKERIYLKLRSNADHFPSEQSKLAHICSMLDQNCQAHLHGSIRKGELKFDSVESMMNELTVLFDDPNRVRDAKARLHSNFQRNKPISTWIAEIRRDAAIAGYENSERLRDIVFLNLNLELEQALIHKRDIYTLNFNSAVARLQDVDNRIQAFSQKLARFNARGSKPILPGFTQLSSMPLTTTQGGDAMDHSAIESLPRGPLSDEEKDRRRKLGLCYYCGKGKHKAIHCGLKTAKLDNYKNNKDVEINAGSVSENDLAP